MISYSDIQFGHQRTREAKQLQNAMKLLAEMHLRGLKQPHKAMELLAEM